MVRCCLFVIAIAAKTFPSAGQYAQANLKNGNNI